MASNLGKVYVELSLDDKTYKQKLSENLTSTQATAKGIETSWKTLGTKSDATFEAQRRSYENACTLIKNSATSTAADIIRAEEAKNAKIKALTEQQVGTHKSSMDRIKEDYFSAFAASQLAVQALHKAVESVTGAFHKGFSAVETYNTSIASMAAMVVTFSKRQEGVSLADQWKDALSYSNALVPVLEDIAAKTLLSGQETNALANAFARSGVFLDGNNQKQIESFTRISNALPLMTQGQDIMRQINSEIRSLMSGQGEATSMMLQTLKAIDPQIEKNLKTWRAEGTVLEHIGEMLVGFGPATALLENQWQAVKSTLDTTVTKVLREGMSGAYEDIIQKNKDINAFLEEHKSMIAGGISIAWDTVQSIIGAAKGLASGTLPILKDAGYLVGVIAYGWGGVLAALKPIGEFLGNSIALTYQLAKAVANVAVAAGALATGQTDAAKVAWEEAKKSYGEVEKLSARNRQLLTEGIADAVAGYDKKARALVSSEETATDSAVKSMNIRGNVAKDTADKAGKAAADMLAALTKQNKEYYESAIKEADAWAAKQRSEYAYEGDVIKEFYQKREDALDTWYDKQWDTIEKNVADEKKRNEMLTTLNLEYGRKQETERTNQLTAYTNFTKKKMEAEYAAASAIQGYGYAAYQYKLQLLEEESKKVYAATGNQSLAYEWLAEQKIKAFEAYAEKEGSLQDRLTARWTKYKRDTLNTSKAMYDAIDAGAQNLEKQMSANFFNVLKGNMSQVSLDWTSMWDSMLSTACSSLSKLVTEAALKSVANVANSGLNWLGSLLGISSMSGSTLADTTSNLFSGAIDTISGLLGLAEGAYTVTKDMIVQVHSGEMVIPADEAQAIREQLALIGASDSSGVVGWAEGPTSFSIAEQASYSAFTAAVASSLMANSLKGGLALASGKAATSLSPASIMSSIATALLSGALAAVSTNLALQAYAEENNLADLTDASFMSLPASVLQAMAIDASYNSPVSSYLGSKAGDALGILAIARAAADWMSEQDMFNTNVNVSYFESIAGSLLDSITAEEGFGSDALGWGDIGGDAFGGGEGGGDGGFGGGGEGGGGFKTGLDYVPRDNFRARLHEGEAVLTKEDATEWRSGKSGGLTVVFNLYATVADQKTMNNFADQIYPRLKKLEAWGH